MAFQSFEDLEVWQRACRLVVEVFTHFRACKEYTLKDQICRAALSVPSNVAEGAGRGSAKDFAHFLNISKGSCGELRTQLYIARKLDLLPSSSFQPLKDRVERNQLHVGRPSSFPPQTSKPQILPLTLKT